MNTRGSKCKKYKVPFILLATILLGLTACAPATTETPLKPSLVSVATVAPGPLPVQDEVQSGRLLFQRSYQPPYKAKTETIVSQMGRLRERRGLSPINYKLVFKRDIELMGGRIEVDLSRQALPEDSPVTGEFDTVFVLVDGSGKGVMPVYVVWGKKSASKGQAQDGLVVDVYNSLARPPIMPLSVWGYWFPFPEAIKEGQKYSLKFSWGKSGNRIYLNDTLLTGYEENAKTAVDSTLESFAPYLRKARLLKIGNDILLKDNAPLDANLLHELRIYAAD